jgi:ketosteroid isomerase-like protein
MTGSNRAFVEGFYEAVGGDVTESFSGERMVELAEVLADQVTEDFECLMIGPAGTQRYPGLAGFAEAWQDWVSPYTSFSIELEDLIEVGDAVLMPVRQRGVTRHGGVAIENSAGSVWRFRDGLLEGAEFYLDRDAAFEAAGVAPGG